MQKITVLCMGRLKEAYWRDAAAEYIKRLSGYCRITVTELPEERLPEHPSAAQIAAALEREGNALLSRIPSGATVISLCIEGAFLTSVELSERIERLAAGGAGELVFVIGSSYGLSPAVKQRAGLRLSMSAMTFPHQLARVMLLEQLYRAMRIAQGGTYHK